MKYRRKITGRLLGAACLAFSFISMPMASASVPGETAAVQAPAYLSSARLHWPVVTGAVQYQVVILKSAEDTPANIVKTIDQVFTNGVEVRLSAYGEAAKSYYWKVCPLDYQGKAIGPFSTPKPIVSAGNDFNPTAPEPTTEFNQMDYAPVYPVYSWIPTADAKHH
ncbi:MAG: SGNH/GDSL hydrolase family protein, partial [Selenomonadaceae bacterium]|nr:SGNH/GDSL hydrolase family protein [Selenomonadaceae bacterium]